MKVLLLNAGSSSLKFSVLESGDSSIIASGLADWSSETASYSLALRGVAVDEEVNWSGYEASLVRVLDDLRQHAEELFSGEDKLQAVGHRFVHGGDYTKATLITFSVRAKIAGLVGLAPLHNPPSLAVLDIANCELPEIRHVACFDTVFHQSMIPAAQFYAIPQEWTNKFGIRRYGFHGLSHAYCSPSCW